MTEYKYGICRRRYVNGPWGPIEEMPATQARLEYRLSEYNGVPIKLVRTPVEWETVKESSGT